MRGVAVVLMVALVATGCAKEKEKPLSEPGEKVFTLDGKILSRDAGDNTVRLDHKAIPGYMEAMTMDYSVRGAKVAQLPPDGSRITATLHVTDNGYWITGVKKVQ